MADRRRFQRPTASEKRLQAGIDSLAKGLGAELWVCREVLGLDRDPDLSAVVAALHRKLHQWERQCDVGANRMLLASVRAAAMLAPIVIA
jgi:hypothetical protein